MVHDWNGITTKAYSTLIELNINEFPISPSKVRLKGVIISSYQKYAKITGLSIADITCGHELDDAFFLSGLRPDLQMILYNREKYDSRLKHTLWHEVGHIKLKHKHHGEQEEIDAHFFAAQANAPNILIKELSQRGYAITCEFLMKYFGLSEESANKKMFYLSKYGFNHTNEFDDLVLQLFSAFIDSNYPPKSKHFYDSYFDELQQERDNWSL